MPTEKVVYNIAMCQKKHHGKKETQRCQCIYHVDTTLKFNYLPGFLYKGSIFIAKLLHV